MANKPTKLSDITTITVVAVWMVQRLNYPTLDEVHKAIKEKLNFSVHKTTLKRVMKGAQRAGFITTQARQTEGGTHKDAFMMKNLDWKSPIEVATVDKLLPAIMATPEAKEIKKAFDEDELADPTQPDEEGNTSSKANKRRNLIDLFHGFRITIFTLTEMLGSQINCEHTQGVREQHPTNIETEEVQVEGIWQRDKLDGAFVIPPDVMQAWFRTNACRYAGLQDSKSAYLGFSPVRLYPERLSQLVLPVNSAKGPSAPKAYETIGAGELVTMRVLAPTKGVLSPAEYAWVFFMAGLRPRRGLSPARGSRYGRFLVVDFEDIGEVMGDAPGTGTVYPAIPKSKKAHQRAKVLEFLLEDLPRSVLLEHGSYAREAHRKLLAEAKATSTFWETDAAE